MSESVKIILPLPAKVLSPNMAVGSIGGRFKTAGVDPRTLDRLFVTDQIPRLEDPEHPAAIKEFIAKYSLEVLCIDPAYLAMSGTDAGNLFGQGEVLRGISEVCAAQGVTVILVHYTKKNTADQFALPQLEDIAWAGFQEFARQWLLLGRREHYMPGTGEHRLWLTTGGSAGHGVPGGWMCSMAIVRTKAVAFGKPRFVRPKSSTGPTRKLARKQRGSLNAQLMMIGASESGSIWKPTPTAQRRAAFVIRPELTTSGSMK